ncbi:1 [Hexamita inflata]|uniref:Alpha-amylase n=1 Tax=Hexamita inflata TaxID=28002 RepID=A0AA86P3X7_9EUKA|nr:1 [Hexamita inflata] [Hexamita inflata]CAI9919417.1 1 [Hexamita inflata] [Hexamita inflata]CAI9930900.1 1 [Hexamita inflata] [Hexamita inflata]CAI9930911.1 1 [Hexamita inflata] [Hexamita inflata]
MLGLLTTFAFPDPREFRKRRIYQLLTDRFAGTNQNNCNDLHSYCGGNYQGLIGKLDYIKNLGYNAIWISPTVEQAQNSNQAYHGYWFSNFYGTNPHFGSAQDLKDMINEAHKRDIWVLADVVYNHVGNCYGGSQDFSCITTFPKGEYYHNDCQVSDWNNQWQVQNCRLSGLPDLNQDHQFVRSELLKWAQWYQKEFNFDGFRIDTVKHIDHNFWKDLRRVTPWFNIGEVFDGSYPYLRSFTNDQEVQTTFNYPLYFTIGSSIGGGQSMQGISNNFHEAASTFGDNVKDLGVFFENHDNQRFLSQYNDKKKYENALALMHTWIGIPVLYYGSEQDMNGGNDPDNRHPMWWVGFNENGNHFQFIKKLNSLRDRIPFDSLDQRELYVANNFYSYARGNKAMVALTNAGQNSGQVHYRVPNSPFEGNARICDVISGECINANGDGSVDVYLNQGQARVYVRESDK